MPSSSPVSDLASESVIVCPNCNKPMKCATCHCAFNRRLEDWKVFENIVQSGEPHWFKDLLSLWRPSGHCSAPAGLRLAIRNNYLNFYRLGQSIARVECVSGNLVADVHYKYVFGKPLAKMSKSPYLRLTTKGVFYRGEQVAAYEGLSSLLRWIAVAENDHAGAEKQIVDELVAENDHVVDLEMAIPAWALSKVAVRMDLVAIENGTVVFWEAKTVDDSRIRCRTEFEKDKFPHVLKQLSNYRIFLEQELHLQQVEIAYRNTAKLLVKLRTLADQIGPALALGSSIVAASQVDRLAVATEAALVVVDLPPGKTGAWTSWKASHESKLEGKIPMRVLETAGPLVFAGAKSEVRLTVHRATNQIGGNCIEIAVGDHRIVLDVGRPLDASNDGTGLLPTTLDLKASMDGVLISHPHQDHYGLLEETPRDWPVFCGEPTRRLMKLTSRIFGEPLDRDFRTWKSGSPFEVGPFRITPYLTDHSAFDAHMLLIEVGGKRLFYSGDFRTHGRKSVLVDRLMASPPSNIDVLLMEGTNLGSDKPCVTECELETDFEALFRKTKGRVFVSWSAQNIDRTVTLYRACLKTGRTLVVDLYTAEVLELLGEFGKLPQPDWSKVKVVVTSAMARLYRRKGDEALVERMVPFGISAKKLNANPENWVVMVRPSLMRDYAKSGVEPNADDAWSWSMWRGYLDNDDGRSVQKWFDDGGSRAAHLHTSGHASPVNLREFANSIGPLWLVPIHGVAWDIEAEGFPRIRRLTDGESMELLADE